MQLFPDTYPSWPTLSKLRVFAEAGKALLGRWVALRNLSEPSTTTVVLAQYELFPYLPAIIESRALPRGVLLVLDFDDAWHHHYRSHRRLLVRLLCGGKIQALMRRAEGVIVGNEYLRSFASRWNDRVWVVPTTIDPSEYPAKVSEEEGFNIGWIGSPATARHLEMVKAPLLTYLRKVGGCLLTVGAFMDGYDDDVVRSVDWSPQNVLEVLKKMHVGIMPLPDSEFERGKCAYKLLQYMAAGKPVIASPVGENVNIITKSGAGYLASNVDDWISHAAGLRESAALRRHLGAKGREFVNRLYTHEHAAIASIRALREIIDSRTV